MRIPTPEDFGLNEDKIIRINKLKDRLISYSTVLIFSICIIGGLYYEFKQFSEKGINIVGVVFSILLGLLLGVFVAVTTLIFIGIPISLIVNHFVRDFKKVEQFEKAKGEYDYWYYRTKVDYWKSLNGFSFERQVGELFIKMGYRVEFTPLVSDGGIDLILFKNGQKTIVQCKNTSSKVGPSVVRDLYGTLIASKASSAILVSASGCSKGALSFLRDKPIRVVSISEIIKMQENLS